MSGVKHTPGPWVVDPHHAGDVQDAMGREIGSTYQAANLGEEWSIMGDIPWDAETMAANARLIAAAPDLLEALESLVEHTNGISLPVTAHMMRNRARDAIARARGEQDGGGE